MYKILIVEPYLILRHAFAMALSPNYQVETVAQFRDAGRMEPDLIIIDAAALQERGLLNVDEQSAIQDREIPIIWIDGGKTAQRSESAKRFCLTWPLDGEALKKAVAGCLEKAGPTSSKVPKPRTMPPASSSSKAVQRSAESAPLSANGGEKKLIELVDIVE